MTMRMLNTKYEREIQTICPSSPFPVKAIQGTRETDLSEFTKLTLILFKLQL